MLLTHASITYAEFDDKYTRQQIEHIDKLMEQMNKLLTVYKVPQPPQFHINLTQNQRSSNYTKK